MAHIGDLQAALSSALRMGERQIKERVRVAQLGNHLPNAGRGAAAQVSLGDAAKALIGICGCERAVETSNAIEIYAGRRSRRLHSRWLRPGEAPESSVRKDYARYVEARPDAHIYKPVAELLGEVEGILSAGGFTTPDMKLKGRVPFDLALASLIGFAGHKDLIQPVSASFEWNSGYCGSIALDDFAIEFDDRGIGTRRMAGHHGFALTATVRGTELHQLGAIFAQ